ncbi:MAG: mannose-1-phosphate guanylyltransferase/mannose-6-phosphate isomerase [Chlamydiota bacterium]
MQIVPVILAGGQGTRLWPLSRKNYPKQFLKLVSKHSLFQETLLRASNIDKVQCIIVVTNELYYLISRDQIAELGLKNVSILLEPFSRNTAPAIALAAHYISSYVKGNTFMFVLPSDHLIKDGQDGSSLNATLQAATREKEHRFLITFGVTPSSPKTGYGYIHRGKRINSLMFNIQSFIEKPSLKDAKTFIKKKNFYWNSGMFLFQPGVYLKELKKHAESIFEAVLKAYRASERKQDYFRIDSRSFLDCPSESIDYAIMEKTAQAKMIPLDFFWSDLGCWSSVADIGCLDEKNNVNHGKVVIKDCKDCFIHSEENKLLVTIGVENLIVVGTSDAMLIMNKRYSQKVKEIVSALHNKEK